MNTSHWQGLQKPSPRPSRRYERLIGELLKNDLLDMKKCEHLAIRRMVGRLTGRYCGRCQAMMFTAACFSCSYEKVREVVYRLDKQSNIKQMNQTIKIRNEVDTTTIDIEGTIGISEAWQFDNPDSRVATYERFRECVASIADIRNSTIRVNIRSTGGDVNDAILIYEALRATGAHITTCCYGYTASAATIVAQAASEGCRLIAPSSLYLIHNSLCSTEGNADELQAEVEMLRQTDRRIAEIYSSRSGRDIKEIAQLMAENGGRGRWLSPAESIAVGLVDGLDGEETVTIDSTLTERAKHGVKALLRAIGLNGDTQPAVEDDINYIPREQPTATTLPSDVKEGVSILFEEHQEAVEPSRVKPKEDPQPIEAGQSTRVKAYEGDARRMRIR